MNNTFKLKEMHCNIKLNSIKNVLYNLVQVNSFIWFKIEKGLHISEDMSILET